MLSEDKIDYLLQIRDSKPGLRPETVKVILRALRWDEDEIARGLEFLKRPAPSVAAAVPTPVELAESDEEVPDEPKPIVIKQNPFPLGAPHHKLVAQRKENRHNHHVLAGFVFGAIVITSFLIWYGYYYAN
ncbi:MAG: hypothetical protein V4467_04035 [Patescibacteria group bacterium]